PVVRSQLACTAKRLPARDALPIVRGLVRRDIDAADPHIPLLLWWAVEHHAIEAREAVVNLFTDPDIRRSSLARETLLPRLVRRYAAAGTPEADAACLELLRPDRESRDLAPLLEALEAGLRERPGAARAVRVASGLETFLHDAWRKAPDDATLLRLL